MDAFAFQRLATPIRRRIRLLLGRALGRLVDPSTLLQRLQLELLQGELADGVEHLEGYGRTAHPPEGYEALVASLGGDRAHTVALTAFHRQFRVRNIAPGEQVLYDDLGNVIWFLRDRILIDAVDRVEVRAPVCHVITTGNVEVTAGGNAVVNAASIELNGTDGAVVTTAHVCAYTGQPHPAGSSTVSAGA